MRGLLSFLLFVIVTLESETRSLDHLNEDLDRWLAHDRRQFFGDAGEYTRVCYLDVRCLILAASVPIGQQVTASFSLFSSLHVFFCNCQILCARHPNPAHLL